MSYKLAYSGLFWRAPDLAQELEALRTFGWDGWEARQPLDWLGTPQRVRQLCETYGVEVAAVCGPNVALDLGGPSQQINKRRIEFAAELGVETFMTKGPGREGRNGTDAELDQMAAAYEDLAAYGADLGVVVTFHPHINHLVDSADEWKRLMSRLDACRLCMDMSHAVHWGYDPVQAVRDFAAWIAYVHLHDFKDGQTVELGEGPMCDYPAFMAALQEAEYTGWVTVCPGEAERPETEKMQINRQYMCSIGY